MYCKLFAVLQIWTLLDYYTTSQKSKKKIVGEIFFEYKKYQSILSVFIYFPTWLSLLKNYPNEPTWPILRKFKTIILH